MTNYGEIPPSPPLLQNLSPQCQLASLSINKMQKYIQNLFMSIEIQQPAVINELDVYFNSHSPGNNVMPLDWWNIHATEFPVLVKNGV